MDRGYSPERSPAGYQPPDVAVGTPAVPVDGKPDPQQYYDGRSLRFGSAGLKQGQPCRKCRGSGLERQGLIKPLVKGAIASGAQKLGGRHSTDPKPKPEYKASSMTVDGNPAQQQYNDGGSFWTDYMRDDPCRKCGGTGIEQQRGIIKPLIRGAIGSGSQGVGKHFNMR